MSEPKKSRASVPPPPKKSFLPDTKAPEAANNMKAGQIAPMTFNMPREWHTEFKATAVMHGMSMKELLVESFKAWKKQNGL